MSLLLIGGLALAGFVASQIFGGKSSGSKSSPSSTPLPPPKAPSSCGGSQRRSATASQPKNTRPSTKQPRSATATPSASPAGGGFGGGWAAQCDMGGGTAVFGDAASPVTVYDAKGVPLQLGVEDERASGGEGTVYTCPKHQGFVIKIYKRSILDNSTKREAIEKRILDMLAIEPLRNHPSIAWPVMPVFDENKRMVGFVMRAVSGTSIRALQGHGQITRSFPGWDRKDLALVARDFLDKMQLLADNGVMVNDFNPANFMVGKDHKVRLIDCDSFQIPAKNGGAPHVATSYFASHVAPELLKNPDLLNRPRGPEQARFGAAIIVFQLLMCGLHPYSHKNGGTPEDNLKAGKCPLGQGSGCQLPAGWYNLVSYLPFSLMETFIKMFRDGHGNPSARPTLATLRDQVDKFLFVMKKDPERRNLAPKAPKQKTKSSNWSGKNNAA